MIRLTKTETWNGCLLKTATLLLMFGGAVQAQLVQQNVFVWDNIFGVGANQNAELILASEGCTKPFTVGVETTDQNGLIAHELMHLSQQSGSVIYPLPVSHNLAERSLFRIKLEIEMGPCSDALQAALAIVNEDGTTVTVTQVPTHTPEWNDLNSNDPGISAIEGEPNSYFNIHPTRIGPSQTAEFAFWNDCHEEISATLQLRTIGTEEEEFILLNVDVAPLAFGQASIQVPSGEQKVHLVGFGTFSVKDRKERSNLCSRNLGALTGALSLLDSEGNTKQVSGLPTGKRQHKPIALNKKP